MSKVQLKKTFTMTLDEVREGLEKLGAGLKKAQGMNYQWESQDRIVFTHKSGKGFVEIRGNELVLELKLGMMYAAMAPMVKNKITDLANEHIT
jgi:putative polyhydroxyalkanoate system protein